jgi:hypothetical protein
MRAPSIVPVAIGQPGGVEPPPRHPQCRVLPIHQGYMPSPPVRADSPPGGCRRCLQEHRSPKQKAPKAVSGLRGWIPSKTALPPRHPVSAQESLLSRAQSSSADANSVRWLWAAKLEAKNVISLSIRRAKALNVPLCIGFLERVNHKLQEYETRLGPGAPPPGPAVRV